MNYRHGFHAGNFADVVKHVVLVAILRHLRRKDKPFCVIDTHAGRGLYDLTSEAARRTGEFAGGIGRFRDIAIDSLPAALGDYLSIVRSFGDSAYPGSPLIAARLLREGDRLVAIERQEEEAAALAQALSDLPHTRVICADGYARLPALLPPPERRGLVLIDPPYEAADEFARLGALVAAARRRFATGIYVVWFPIKSSASADALAGELMASAGTEMLRIVTDVGKEAGSERLSAAGLLVLNPPYKLDEEMRTAAAVLAPRLGKHAAISIMRAGAQ